MRLECNSDVGGIESKLSKRFHYIPCSFYDINNPVLLIQARKIQPFDSSSFRVQGSFLNLVSYHQFLLLQVSLSLLFLQENVPGYNIKLLQ